jgi:H+/gluconate symporter-like permease
MKNIVLGAVLGVIVATTGAVSASANEASPFQGLPTWAQEVLAPKN